MSNRSTRRVAILVVALLAAPSACGGGTSEAPGHGVVMAVDADARTISLDHEEIPGLMKAMTMTFRVAPGVSLAGLEPGAAVDFRVKEEAGVYTVTEIRAAGP